MRQQVVRSCVFLCSLLMFVTLVATPRLRSQTPTVAEIRTITDFRTLSDLRSRLESQSHDAQQKVDKLESEMADIAYAEQAIQNFEAQVADPNNKDKRVAEGNVKGWKDTLAKYRKKDLVQSDLEAAKKELSDKQSGLANVESQLKVALDVEKPKQEFKTKLSIAFSILTD